MSQDLTVVTGATGNIGKELTRLLLAKGKKVRAIGRSVDKLKFLAAQGAETSLGSLDDAAAMKKAFQGATAAFVMIPPHLSVADVRAYQNKVSEALAQAVQAAGVKHVVHLSSVGAHLSSKNGPIAGLYNSEQRFNQLKDVSVVFLRPAFFMENHLWSVGTIKQMGVNGSPLRGDLVLPMIATRDIAAAAAELLISLNFSGKIVRELLGSRDYTMDEVTRVLGRSIGRGDLKYVQFPYADAEKALLGMGLSPDVAGNYIEMYRGMNEGLVKPTEPRSAKNTTATSLEEFSKVFASVYGVS